MRPDRNPLHKLALLVFVGLLVGALLPYASAYVDGAAASPVGNIRCSFTQIPDDYQPRLIDMEHAEGKPSEEAILASTAPASDGLKGIAIIGDVSPEINAWNKQEMDDAVAELEYNGATVTKFYYGDTIFTWADIVAAAPGAHFLLYMGHGTPGGSFVLSGSQFVLPEQVRNDLGGVVASNSLLILSHVCYSAGSAEGDSGTVSQSEAESRVAAYAQPFVDIGMQAYFSNNYVDTAVDTVRFILRDKQTMGEAFKSGYGYNVSGFVDLTYPEAGYDLWLNKSDGDWHLAFVGMPDYVFQTTGPSNQAPYAPSNPAPGNGLSDIPTDQVLSWQGGDPDGDVVTYTVAFGTSNPPPFAATTTQTSYSPSLAANTTYYWSISATDGTDTTAGSVWSFTTVVEAPPNQAPYAPSDPGPMNGATDVPVVKILTWQGGDPDNDALTYNVAFGDTDLVPVVATGLAEPHYCPGALISNTIYAWYIMATDGISTTTGPMWYFTTGSGVVRNVYVPLLMRE